mgnify:CR=1 FL=1
MARLFSSGFELQSVVNGVEFDTNTGPATISTSVVRSGAASMRCGTSALARWVRHQFQTDTINTTYHRFYMRIDSLPAAITDIWNYLDSGNTVGFTVRLNTSGQLVVRNDAAGATVLYTSSALSLTTWYRIEIKIVDHATTSAELELKLDGTVLTTLTGLTGLNGGGKFRLGSATATATDLYFDDYAVNNTAGSAQTGYPGAGSIVHMHPNGAGDNNGASSGDYTSVEEVIPDNETTIAVLDANNDILDVACESSSAAGIGASDTISVIQVGVREAAFSAASESWKLRIKSASGATVAESAVITHNDTTYRTNGDTTFYGYQLTSDTDPTTAAAWTPTGTNSLDNMQIGIQAVDATPDIKVSTLWALVEYVPSVGGGDYSINKSDSITVTESVQRKAENYVNKSDTATITESIGRMAENRVSVSDTATITEATKFETENRVSVSDSSTVTEATTLLITELFITTSDSSTVSESIQRMAENRVSVSDSSTVTENVQLTTALDVNKSDSVTVTESTKLEITSFVNVSEGTTVSENILREAVNRIETSDNFTITENTVVSIAVAGDLYVAVSDSATVSESLQRETIDFVATSDLTTITESTKLAAENRIHASDSSTLTEFTSLEVNNFIAKSESVTVTEAVTLLISDLNVATSDTTTITEVIAVSIIESGVRSVTVFDTITADESVTLLIPDLNISKSDSITVTESVVVSIALGSYSVAISDTATVTEQLTLLVSLNVLVSDTSTITENIPAPLVYTPPLSPSVSDTVTVTAALQLQASRPATICRLTTDYGQKSRTDWDITTKPTTQWISGGKSATAWHDANTHPKNPNPWHATHGKRIDNWNNTDILR